MIRRYISWRNNHACEERLRRIVAKTNVARCALQSLKGQGLRWLGVEGESGLAEEAGDETVPSLDAV